MFGDRGIITAGDESPQGDELIRVYNLDNENLRIERQQDKTVVSKRMPMNSNEAKA
jgi:hypothetical protein